jgi:hypothetical protein
VDREFRLTPPHDRDDFEEIGIACRSEIQPSVAGLIVNGHRVHDCVFDVFVGDAVLSRRRMNLYHEIVIRNSTEGTGLAVGRQIPVLCAIALAASCGSAGAAWA